MKKPRPTRQRMHRIVELLETEYERPRWTRETGGVGMLVATILSQHTSDKNSAAAFRQLWRRFRNWNAVANAPVEEIERHIRVSGLSRLKAPRIRSILRAIREEHGKIDIEFLAGWPAGRAMEYLLKFKGVGPKTAACVLLFAFGMAVFPVDTHIHRIAQRLGLVSSRATAEQTQERLLPLIEPRDCHALHIMLIAHARQTCRASSPKCGACVLRRMCPSRDRVILVVGRR
ncbi:MAG: endonuclease III domain-containing protein [Tepidisphaerales bacterium]